MAHKGPRNLLGATGARMSVLRLEGGWKARRPGVTPVTSTVLSLHRLDNVHGSRVEPSETARMNSMDRHIQQTNDRLQCIKQVGVWPAFTPLLPGNWQGQAVGVLSPVAGHLGLFVEVMVGMDQPSGAPWPPTLGEHCWHGPA